MNRLIMPEFAGHRGVDGSWLSGAFLTDNWEPRRDERDLERGISKTQRSM